MQLSLSCDVSNCFQLRKRAVHVVKMAFSEIECEKGRFHLNFRHFLSICRDNLPPIVFSNKILGV